MTTIVPELLEQLDGDGLLPTTVVSESKTNAGGRQVGPARASCNTVYVSNQHCVEGYRQRARMTIAQESVKNPFEAGKVADAGVQLLGIDPVRAILHASPGCEKHTDLFPKSDGISTVNASTSADDGCAKVSFSQNETAEIEQTKLCTGLCDVDGDISDCLQSLATAASAVRLCSDYRDRVPSRSACSSDCLHESEAVRTRHIYATQVHPVTDESELLEECVAVPLQPESDNDATFGKSETMGTSECSAASYSKMEQVMDEQQDLPECFPAEIDFKVSVRSFGLQQSASSTDYDCDFSARLNCSSTVPSRSSQCKCVQVVVRRMLGSGAFGKVCLAKNKLNGSPFVVKQIEHERFLDNEFWLPYWHPHKNIVASIAMVERDKWIYLLQGYVPGYTLETIWKEQRKRGAVVSDLELDALGICMLQALAHLAQHRIVHCDIKPPNIIRRPRAAPGVRYVLIDFGLSEQLLDGEDHRFRQAFRGTLQYAAPECHSGYSSKVSQRGYSTLSDVWSLGITLMQMCTFTLPFDGHGHADIRHLLLSDSEYVLRQVLDERAVRCSSFWRHAIFRMLSFHASARPQPADLFAELREKCLLALPDFQLLLGDMAGT